MTIVRSPLIHIGVMPYLQPAPNFNPTAPWRRFGGTPLVIPDVPLKRRS
ncbi:hypothetical protein [Phormidesmis priestleyi]|nr:hypothetical protein [Phormidesmis priestleyi]